jgi:hypothetical protein
MTLARKLTLVGCALAMTACSTTPKDHHDHFQATAHPPVMLSHLHAFAGADNDARRATLVAMLESHGFEPELVEFPNEVDRKGDPRPTGTNVSFTVGDGEKEIIVGAHYDTVLLPDGSYSQGMVDNAASVIALVHVAEELAAHGDSPHKVRFVFFDMEEIGLVGSAHLARTLDPADVVAMINLDVNAYGDVVFYGATQHGHAPVYEAMRASCRDLDQDCVDFPSYPPSDYLSFEEAGIPNVSISVMPRAEVYQLWLRMNRGDRSGLAEGFWPESMHRIHSSGDRFESVQPEAVIAACDVVLGLIHHLAHVEFPATDADHETMPEIAHPLKYDE